MPSASHTASALRESHDHLLGALATLFPGIDENLLRQLMDKMEWQQVHAGETLFEQGDTGDSLYVVLSGRLQAIVNDGTTEASIAGEITKGESAGEMSLVTGEARTATVRAVRDCILAKLDKADFERIAAAHPQVIMGISRQVIKRLTTSIHRVRQKESFTSIAIFPASPNIDVSHFTSELQHAIAPHSNTLVIDEFTIRNRSLSPEAGKDVALINWLSEQEVAHDALLYQTDGKPNAFTKTCLRQADKILVVTNAGEDPQPAREELELTGGEHTTPCELAIIHPPETTYPKNTKAFLANRKAARHYHIKSGSDKDMQRLGRLLTGKANALVLSGGGAKGFAHIGVYKALTEAKIPVDIVAGTSIGSIMAATIAMGWNLEEIIKNTRKAFVNDKPLKDFTLPLISLIKGKRLQKVTKQYFNDVQIEDLWINFFCVTSNFSTSRPMVHQQGSLYKTLTASASIPGVLPPVVVGNNLLIDGGVFNNFPVDIMRQLYSCNIIGVDLNTAKEYQLNYDHIPGGWHYLLTKLLPIGKRYRVPGIATIMMKSTLLGSKQKQVQMKDDVDLYLKPPVGKYKLLDMKAYDPLVKSGYEYATQVLQDKNITTKVWHD